MVDDDGPGIPPDKLDDIFERFYSDRPQSDSTHRQELGPRLEHLARYRRRVRRAASRPATAIAEMHRRERSTTITPRSRERRAPGVAGDALHGAPAGGGCSEPQKERSSLPDAAELVHGTCVALGQRAALLRGPSGSGKSDLALRFLFLARRGPAALEAPVLVADDQVRLSPRRRPRSGRRAGEHSRARSRCAGSASSASSPIAESELVLVVDLVDPGGDGAPAGQASNSAASRHRPAAAAVGAVRGFCSHQAGPGPGARGPNLSATPVRIAGVFPLASRRRAEPSCAPLGDPPPSWGQTPGGRRLPQRNCKFT